jgi:hypothetical protein
MGAYAPMSQSAFSVRMLLNSRVTGMFVDSDTQNGRRATSMVKE